jgi:flagellar basal-body rod protein FlgF
VFRLDDQGRIVNTEGHAVLDVGGAPITIPPNGGNIVVTHDGTINVDGQPIGQLKLVDFANEAALSKEGNSLYNPGEQTPQPAPEAEILQGMVEGSNVSGIVEMTRMIDTTRAYQAAGRLAETEHQRILDAIKALVSTA